MCAVAVVPVPFPLGSNVEDDPCLVCKSELDADWICTKCYADHFKGVMLLIGYGSPKRGAQGILFHGCAAGQIVPRTDN